MARLFAAAGALVIILSFGNAATAAENQRFTILAAPHASVTVHTQRFGSRAKKATMRSAKRSQLMALGATVESVLAAGRQLNPALRAAALDTAAAAAKAAGADALDDPTISNDYNSVMELSTLMVTQRIPLWGKLSLRRELALAELDAARGREQSARDALDERIKIAFAQYYAASRAIAINSDVIATLDSIRAAAEARYATGRGKQAEVIKALSEKTAAEIESARLEGEQEAAREILNALIARPATFHLANPLRLRPVPSGNVATSRLVERARYSNPKLATSAAKVNAARTRITLAERAWYPDLTIGAGPAIATNNRSAGVAATVGLNIPLPWGKETSEQQAATAELGAAQQRYDAVLLDIQSALAEAGARLMAARKAVDLIARKALPEARATLKSVIADYAQGRSDLPSALAAQRRVFDLELKLLQLQVEEQTELAAIERLIGDKL